MEEAWVGEFSGPVCFFAKLTVDKQNHKVSRLCGETKERSGKGRPSQTPQSRQTYGRMFNLLSSP